MGLILLNKKTGVTSFEALRDIKRTLGTGKVGHTGTLDKFAQGLLLVLTGRALKLSKWFSGCDKQYIGKIHFGAETDTLDPEGTIVAQAPVLSLEQVEQVLPQFTGAIMQSPPAYSAIHINGKRASELARSGKQVEMKKRPVTIYKLDLISWEAPFAEIFVHCSSGTYIRSLARDIALAAGSRAHLCALTRTQIAGFSLERAENIEPKVREQEFEVLPIDKAVISALSMPCFDISSLEAEKIIHGKPLAPILDSKNLSFTPAALDFSAAVFNGENLVAIVERNAGQWKYDCVM